MIRFAYPPVRVIDTSSLLFAAEAYWEDFLRTADESVFFTCAERFDITAFNVSEDELNRELRKADIPIPPDDLPDHQKEYAFNPDYLGIFIPYAKEMAESPLIKLSAKKILIEAKAFQKRHNYSRKLKEIFRVLFLEVLFHELGHALMNCEANWRDALWQKQKSPRLFDNEKLTNHAKNLPNLKAIRRQIAGCRANGVHRFAWYKLFEESLANRFATLHRWNDWERNIVWKLIKDQPPEYAAAISWQSMRHEQVLRTMCAWRAFKCDDLVVRLFTAYPHDAEDFLDAERQALAQGAPLPPEGIDFKERFFDFALSRVEKWLLRSNAVLYGEEGLLIALADHLRKQGDQTEAEHYQNLARV